LFTTREAKEGGRKRREEEGKKKNRRLLGERRPAAALSLLELGARATNEGGESALSLSGCKKRHAKQERRTRGMGHSVVCQKRSSAIPKSGKRSACGQRGVGLDTAAAAAAEGQSGGASGALGGKRKNGVGLVVDWCVSVLRVESRLSREEARRRRKEAHAQPRRRVRRLSRGGGGAATPPPPPPAARAPPRPAA
jgi:hypothetical protein